MTGDDFRKQHNEYLEENGKKLKFDDEPLMTWLMAESGLYFLLEGSLEAKLKQLKNDGLVCTVHENQTSLGMSHEQAKLERFQ